MVHGILYNRLNGERRHQRHRILRQIKYNVETVIKTCFFQGQVRSYQLQLFLDRHGLSAVLKVEAAAQILAQIQEQLRCHIRIIGAHRDNGIERIVQKMRFDLGLQKGDFCLYRGADGFAHIQQRTHTRPEFTKLYRCTQVIIRARLKGSLDVFRPVAGCKHQNGQLREDKPFTNRLA
ncbi:hypothetical protein D3C74_390290 [compost metagenome]